MKNLFLHFFLATIIAMLTHLKAGAAVSDDQHWDDQFGPPGVNASPYAILATVGKNVFVAGSSETAAGGLKANGIARFDGTNWFQLNSGLLANSGIVGIGSDGNYLYVGGIFTNADDPNAVDTARWDGTNWSSVGIQGVMLTVKRNGANLYFAGNFSSAGGVAATNIARWDGTNWWPLGTGVAGCTGFLCLSAVNCLAFQGNNVYAGGNFTSAGGVNASYIAYFDGNNWNAMGNLFSGPVTALTYYGSYLYAGGAFTNTSLGLTNLARWDGGAWSSPPGGGANRQVMDFATDGTNLFVGGLFTQIGGIASTGVVSFNASSWTSLGGGVQSFQGTAGQVYKMACLSNQLFVAGSFERAGNVGAANVARWDGTNWWNLSGPTGHGMTPALDFTYSLLPVNGSIFVPSGLYAGGTFSVAGNTVVNHIGWWDGTNWNALGGGMANSFGGSINVRALAANNAYIYAGGNFTSADGNPASGVAYWDGTQWNALGSGVDWIVNALAIDDANYIYVGGTFTNAGGIYSRGFAVNAYGSWYNFGNVEGTNGAVNSIAYDGGSNIYIGGSFFTAGGVSASNVAYFDNSDFSWHALGNGLNAKPNTLAYGNGLLYAGGSFTRAGAVAASHIAQWDGTNWSALGSGITGGSSTPIVNAIIVAGTNVYVTGNFTNAGGVNATNIAQWNGSSWSALGSGLDIPRAGYALAAVENDIYVGGNFTMAGDKPAEFISRWNDQSNFYPLANIQLTRQAWLTNNQFRFRLIGTSGQSYVIQGTTNLKVWTPLQTNSTTYYDYTDTNAANYSSRIYRAVLGP